MLHQTNVWRQKLKKYKWVYNRGMRTLSANGVLPEEWQKSFPSVQTVFHSDQVRSSCLRLTFPLSVGSKRSAWASLTSLIPENMEIQTYKLKSWTNLRLHLEEKPVVRSGILQKLLWTTTRRTLMDRSDNKRIIWSRHLKFMFKHPVLTTEDGTGLWKLLELFFAKKRLHLKCDAVTPKTGNQYWFLSLSRN